MIFKSAECSHHFCPFYQDTHTVSLSSSTPRTVLSSLLNSLTSLTLSLHAAHTLRSQQPTLFPSSQPDCNIDEGGTIGLSQSSRPEIERPSSPSIKQGAANQAAPSVAAPRPNGLSPTERAAAEAEAEAELSHLSTDEQYNPFETE